MRPSPGPSAPRRVAALAALFAFSLLSCGREVTGPDRSRIAMLAFAPEFTGPMAAIDGAGDAVPFEKVRVVLRREDGSILKDTLVDFPSDAEFVELALTIPIPQDAPSAGLPLTVAMAYVNAAGDTVFRGGPNPLVAKPLGTPGATDPVNVPVVYDGPGKGAARVAITPKTGSVVSGGSTAFAATAFDDADRPINNTPFVFSSLDTTRGVVNPSTGVATWRPVRGTARIVAELPNGLRADTATFTVALPASKLVLGSGGAQTGAVNAALGDTIILRTLASDDVPVQGVVVSFAVTTGAGSLSVTTDTSDADGNVKTVWTLGATLGAQSITATSAGLTGSPLVVGATATAAAPVRLEIQAQPTAGVAGAALAPALTVIARDAFGNAVPTFADSVVIVVAGAQPPTLGGSTTRVPVSGTAAFEDLALTLAGEYTLIARSGALAPDTTTAISIAPAAAARLSFVQEPVNAVAGAALTPALTVRSTDAFGNLTPTFTGPIALTLREAGTATLAGTATQNAVAGVATFADLSVQKAGTGYRLEATSGTLQPDTSVAFSITAASASQFAIVSGNEQTGVAGAALASPLTVVVRDGFGNPVSGASVTWAITTGGGSLGATTSVTDSDGRASTTWTLGNGAGAQSATASVATLTDVVFSATATAGAPAQLVLSAIPASDTAGSPLAVLTATLRDALGNVVTTFTGDVSVSLATNPAAGTLEGTVTRAAVAGVVSFDDLVIKKAGAGYTLRASIAAPAISSDTTAAFAIAAAAAAQFAIESGNNQSVVAGSAFPQPLRVRVLDAFGNPKAGHPTQWSSVDVVTLAASGTVLTDAAGIAENTATAATVAGPQSLGPSVTATDVSGTLIFEHVVTAGTATQLVFTSQPDTVTAGEPFPPTLFVEFRDALGNRVTTLSDSVTMSIESGPPTGALLPPSVLTQFIPSGGGPAGQFAGLEINVAGTYVLRGTTKGGLTGVSAPLVVRPDGFRQLLLISGGNDTATVNQPFGAPLRVRVLDSHGNPVSGAKTTWIDQGGGAVLAGDTVLTDASGYAENTATHPAVPVAASAVTAFVIGGADSRDFFYTTLPLATRVAVTAAPASTIVPGAAFSVGAEARDALGNLANAYGDSATISIRTGPAGATLGGTLTRAMVAGAVTFTGLSVDRAGTYRLQVSSAGLIADTSVTFTAEAGAPDTVVVVSGDFQLATLQTSLANPLVVEVRDQFGNPVPNVSVDFMATSGAASVTVTPVLTDAAGRAESNVVIGTTTDTVRVSATATGVTTPAIFTALPQAGAPANLYPITQPTNVDAGQTMSAFVFQVRDGFGNVVRAFNDTVSLEAGAPASLRVPGLIKAGAAVVAVNGVATFSAVRIDSAGVWDFTITAKNGPIFTSDAFTVTAGAPSLLLKAGGDGQTATVATTLASPLRVRVTDAYGNGIGGVTVNFNDLSGTLAGFPLSIETDAAGVAETTPTLGTIAGSVVVGAFAAGLTPDSVLFTLAATPDAVNGFQLVSGGEQTVAAGDTTANAWTVRAKDGYGNAVPNVTVSFVTFDDVGFTETSVITDANGDASTKVIAGPSIGLKTVYAQAVGASSLTTTVEVVAGIAKSLNIITEPASDTAGATFTTTSVQVLDAFGNLVTTAGTEVTLAVDAALTAGTIEGTTTATAVAGVASFPGLRLTKSGEYRFVVTAAGLTPDTTATFEVSTAAATEMTIVSGNNQPTAVGAALAQPMRIRVRDAFGNPIAAIGIVWGTSVGVSQVDSTVSYTDADGYAEMGLTMATTREDPSVEAAYGDLRVTFTHTGIAAAAATMEITGMPGDRAAGTTLSPITVTLRDTYGNVATAATGSVSVALATSPASSTLSGTTSASLTLGVATFSDLVLTKTGQYVLRFSTSGLADVDTDAFFITAAAPDTILVLYGDPQTVAVGGTSDSMVVQVLDAFGNPVPDVVLNWSSTVGTALTFASTSTDADGRALNYLGVGTTAGNLSASVAGEGLITRSFAITASAGTAVALRSVSAPTTATSGVAADAFVIEAVDEFDNRVTTFTGNVTIAKNVEVSPNGSIGGTLTVAAVAGVATFDDLLFSEAGSYGLAISADGLTGFNSSINVQAGAEARVALMSQPSSGTAGTALDMFLVRVTDAAGNVVGGSSANISVAVDASLTAGSLGGTTTKQIAEGSADFLDLELTATGSYRLVFSAPGLVPDTSASFVVSPAPASAVAVVGGNMQTVTVGTAADSALALRVTDAYGNPIVGWSVDWSVTSGAATPDSLITTTDADGVARTTFRAGSTVGSIQIEANASLAGSATFTAEATAGAAEVLAITTAPLDAVAGATLAGIVVQAEDSLGNVATGFTGTVTVSIEAGGPAGATLGGTLSANATAGVVTFSDLTLDKIGAYRLRFTADGTTPIVSDTFKITAAAADSLVYVSGTGQMLAPNGQAADSLVVRVADRFGNPVAEVPVSWGVSVGTALVSSSSVLSDSLGFSKIALTASQFAESGEVTAVNAGLTGSPVTFTYNTGAGAAAALNFSVNPTNAVAGETLSSLAVEVVDAFGNRVTGFTDPITIEIYSDPAPAIFGTTSFAPTAGLATFSDLRIEAAGTYQLRASAAGLPDSLSASFTIAPAAAAQLAFVQAPTTATAGEALSPAVVVAVRDAFGNAVVAGGTTVTLDLDSTATVGPIGGTVNLVSEVGSGLAQFTGISLTLAGEYAFVVRSGALAADTTDAFTVAPGEGASVEITSGDGQSGAVGTAIANPLAMTVRDAFGNPVPNTGVFWSVSVGGEAVLDSAAVFTDSLGVARTTLTFGSTVRSFTVTGSAGDAGSVNFSLSAVNAPAATLTTAFEPGLTLAGATLGLAEVDARDSLGNQALDFVGEVSVVVDSGPSGATIGGTTTVNAVAGRASFSDLSLSVAGAYRLRFTATGLDSAVSNTFTVSAAAAVNIAIADGNAQTGTVNTALGAPLVARVTDAFGNPVSGVSLTWTASPGVTLGESAIGTGLNGEMSQGVTLGTTAGSYSVVAAISDLPDSSVTFTMTAEAGAAAALVVTSAPTTATAGDTVVVRVEARDAYGNLATSFTGNVSFGLDDQVAQYTVTAPLTAAGGVVEFTDLVFGDATTFNVLVGSLGLADVGFSVAVSAGAAAQLQQVSGMGQSGFATLPLDTAFTVRALDAFGNPVSGASVDWTVLAGSGGGLVNGSASTGTTTDASGYASVNFTAGTTIGLQTARAVLANADSVEFDVSVSELIGNAVWTGNADTSWTNSANWIGGIVPTAFDSVYIPSGRPTYPVLIGDVAMTKLVIDDGVTGFDIGSFNVTVSGSIRAPATSAFAFTEGTVIANGSGAQTISGELPTLTIENGRYAVTPQPGHALFINGELALQSGGRLVMDGGDSVVVNGGIQTFDTAGLEQAAGSSISAQGDVVLAGVTGAGVLTGGRLYVRGAFSTTNADPGTFRPAAEHETHFTGSNNSITLAAPDVALDTSCALQCFGVIVATYAGLNDVLDINSHVKARRFDVQNFRFRAPNHRVIAGAGSALVSDSLGVKTLAFIDQMPTLGAVAVIDSAIVAAGAGTLPTGLTALISVQGYFSINGTHNGDLDVYDGGVLDVVGSAAAVTGTLSTSTNGSLRMADAGDVLTVGGNAVFNGAASDTDLTAGTLRVAENFTASASAFIATPSHTVELYGAVESSLDFFGGSGATDSRFGRLLLNKQNGLALGGGAVFVDGQLETVGTEQRIIGVGTPLTIRGAQIGGLLLSDLPLVILDGAAVTQLDNLEFADNQDGVTQLRIERDSLEVPINTPVFDTVATNPTYLELVDATVGPESLTVTVVNPAPEFHVGRIVIGSRATLSGWSPYAFLEWTNGGGNRQWNNPANWSAPYVPQPGDSVYVSGEQPPIIQFPASVRALVSTALFPIDVQAPLTVSERLILPATNGAACADSGVVLKSAPAALSIAGDLQCGLVATAGAVTLTGTSAMDSLVIGGTASVTPDGNELTVRQRLVTADNGTLVMGNEVDIVRVFGPAVFGSTPTGGTLTLGRLELHDSFTQSGSATAFQGGANHITALLRSQDMPVTFANPDSSAAGSHFGSVEVALDEGGTQVQLGSDIYVNGVLRAPLSANSREIAALATSRTVVARGTEVPSGSNLGFYNVALRIAEGANLDPDLYSIGFYDMPDAVTQMEVVRSNGMHTFHNFEFDTAAVGALLLVARDADSTENGQLEITMVNPDPAFNFFRIDNPGAAIYDWPDFPQFVWNGNVSDEWSNPGNWDDGVVPFTGVRIEIPVTSRLPAAIPAGTYGSLDVYDLGAGINIDGIVTFRGSVNAPTGGEAGLFCGSNPANRIIVDGVNDESSISGNMYCAVQVINGAVGVNGDTRTRFMLVSDNGGLDLGVSTLTIDSTFTTQTGGTLTMTEADARLVVGSRATFDGGSTTGLLTAGIIRTGTGLVQEQNGVPTSFDASGTHTVIVDNQSCLSCGPVVVGLNYPAQSGFQNLQLDAGDVSGNGVALTVRGDVTLGTSVSFDNNSELRVDGSISGDASTSIQLNAAALRLGGDWDFSGSWIGGTLQLVGTAQSLIPQRTYTMPIVIEGNVSLGTNVEVSAPYNLGSSLVVRNSGSMTIAPPGLVAAVFVEGVFAVEDSATVTMQSASGSLTVEDTARFDGGDTDGLLTAGTLSLEGDLVVSGKPGALRGGPGFTTRFTGTGAQRVSFALPGYDPGASHLGDIEVAGAEAISHVTLATDVWATGQLRTGSPNAPNRIVSNATDDRWLRLRGLSVIDSLTLDGISVRVDDGDVAGVVAGLRFLNLDGSAMPNLEFNRAGGTVQLANTSFDTGAGFTGDFLVARDTDTMDDDTFTIEVTGTTTPAAHAGRVLFENGAILENWLEEVDFIWTGAVNEVWTNPANWSSFAVPTATDSVFVPATVITMPEIALPATVRALVSEKDDGAILVSGATLTITELLSMPANDGLTCGVGGRIALVGNATPGSVGGYLDCELRVRSGTFSLAANTLVARDQLLIDSTGTLAVGERTLTLGEGVDLVVADSGLLQMTDAAGSVQAAADVTFGGRGSAGALTAGSLDVAGNFTQTGSSEAFAASNSHRTRLTSTTATITFATPGAAASHFGSLQAMETGTSVTLNSDVYVAVNLTTESVNADFIGGGGVNRLMQTGGIRNGGAGTYLSNVRVRLVDGGTDDIVNLVSFSSMDPTVTYLTVDRAGGTTSFPNLSFGPTPTTGRYLVARDTVSDASALVVALSVVNPQGHSGYIEVQSDATISGWDEFAQYTFLGTEDTNAGNPDNWDTGVLPAPTSNVRFDNASGFGPVSLNGVSYRNVSFASGAQVTIDGVVNAQKVQFESAPSCTGAGNIILTPAAQSSDNLVGSAPSCAVTLIGGTSFVTDTIALRAIIVGASAQLWIGNTADSLAQMTLADSLAVLSGGELHLRYETSEMTVEGQARFAVGSFGLLDKGTLNVWDSLRSEAFFTLGSTRVVLGDPAAPSSFSMSIGAEPGRSIDSLFVREGTLNIVDSATVNEFIGVLGSGTTITGDRLRIGTGDDAQPSLRSDGTLALTESDELTVNHLEVYGSLGSVGSFNVDTVTFLGQTMGTQQIPADDGSGLGAANYNYNLIRVAGSAVMQGADNTPEPSYTVLTGIRVVDGGGLLVAGTGDYPVTVDMPTGGDLIVDGYGASLILDGQDTHIITDSVFIRSDAQSILQGTNTSLTIGSDLILEGLNGNSTILNANGTGHVTRFTGNGTIRMGEGTGASQLGIVEVRGGTTTTLLTDLFVQVSIGREGATAGTITFRSANPGVDSTPRILTFGTDFVGAEGAVVMRNVGFLLESSEVQPGNGFALDNVTFQQMHPEATFLYANFKDTQTPTFNDITFDSPVGDGAYFFFDNTDVTGLPTVTFVNASPSLDCLTGTCEPGDVAPSGISPTATYIEEFSTVWDNPAHWSTGAVPDANTNVIIPAGKFAALFSDASAKSVTVESGGTLGFGGTLSLNLWGNLDVQGEVTGFTGTVRMRHVPGGSTLSVQGSMETKLEIAAGLGGYEDVVSLAGNVNLTENFAENGTTVSAGILSLGSYDFADSGSFRTTGTGRLRMDNSLGELIVFHDIEFGGGSTDGLLTAGEIRVLSGDFIQDGGNSSNSFVSSGSHRVSFNGPFSTRIVANSMTDSTSRFNSVYFLRSGGDATDFASDTVVIGSIPILSGILRFTGGSLVVTGSLGEITGHQFAMDSAQGIVDLRGTLPAPCATSTLNVTGYKGQFIPSTCHTEALAWFFQDAQTLTPLNAVWGTGNGSVLFAVGDNGTIRFSDQASSGGAPGNVTWAADSAAQTDHLLAVHGLTSAADTAIYAVGANGRIVWKHSLGDAWSVYSHPSTTTWRGVHVLSPSTVVIVGDGGAIIVGSDSSWTPATSGTLQNLYGITRAGGDFVVAGAAGTLLVSADGLTWASGSTGLATDLFAISAVSGAERYVGGAAGTLGLDDGSTVQNIGAAPRPVPQAIRGVVATGFGGLAVGDNFRVLHQQGQSWTVVTAVPNVADLRGVTSYFDVVTGLQVAIAVAADGSIYYVSIGAGPP
ncbi:Ig-like domain-containing protein [Pseudogemmatithrix spongiicola]|uniref:Ig-like domain-containing protein n=1 Tax=Pseudogemmatithrix spongiicola TaxID=3062599 RepID=A0AA49JWD4_9BACT|nr:Ig-like domain-containing protein [Gemmatimonadaceae bacterium 'strain 138']WKW16113.1 Ig-like domain-containing protein [Gemmatimonadaceae bacterium 'strain 318']